MKTRSYKTGELDASSHVKNPVELKIEIFLSNRKIDNFLLKIEIKSFNKI